MKKAPMILAALVVSAGAALGGAYHLGLPPFEKRAAAPVAIEGVAKVPPPTVDLPKEEDVAAPAAPQGPVPTLPEILKASTTWLSIDYLEVVGPSAPSLPVVPVEKSDLIKPGLLAFTAQRYLFVRLYTGRNKTQSATESLYPVNNCVERVPLEDGLAYSGTESCIEFIRIRNVAGYEYPLLTIRYYRFAYLRAKNIYSVDISFLPAAYSPSEY